MRIIAGKFKSRHLKTLKGDQTRPSSDRLKEAMFNQLGPYFDKGSFLDIFGGSGAVGLEALSRGFEDVTFIEKNPKAAKIIKENVKTLDVSRQVEVKIGDAKHILKTIEKKYDIIFMDPPYEFNEIDTVVYLASLNLKENGWLIIETYKDIDINVSDNIIKKDTRVYGIAKLHYYQMP